LQKKHLPLHLVINNSINQCAAEWDRLLPDGHLLSSHHLKAFEQANIADINCYYVQVWQNNKNIGRLYIQWFSLQHKHIRFGTALTAGACVARCLLPAQMPVLVCGHLFRIHYPGFYFSNPAHESLVFEAIQTFINQQKMGKPVGILIKDCEHVFARQSCQWRGYRYFDGDVTMEIVRKSQWHSFQDYLASLNKNYRQRARKIKQAFDPICTRLLNEAEIIANANQLCQLYLNVVEKQTIKLGIVNGNYFVELKRDLGDHFECHALYAGEKMVGFYTFIFYATDMETHFIGLDYEANEQYKLYFNILFAGIEKMIEKKLNKLELGRTARLAKANTGAVPKQVINYIWLRNRVANWALRYYLQRFNKNENKNIQQRNPFK
jgi:hypothetical protein